MPVSDDPAAVQRFNRGAAIILVWTRDEGDHVDANERTLRRRRDPITLLL
jgi:hypothetical protein